MIKVNRTARAAPLVAYVVTRKKPEVRQYLTPYGPIEVPHNEPQWEPSRSPSGCTLYKGERGARMGIRHALAKVRAAGDDWISYGWHAPAGGAL